MPTHTAFRERPRPPQLAAGGLLLLLAACGRPDPAVPGSGIGRLISESPRRTLAAGAPGIETAALPSAFGSAGWSPAPDACRWRLDGGALVFPSPDRPFDLVRSVDLDAADLHTLEVTLASDFMVTVHLSWKRRGAADGPAGRLTRTYNEARRGSRAVSSRRSPSSSRS